MGKIIGIDLGTTNSVVAVMEHGEPVVIPSSRARGSFRRWWRSIPSQGSGSSARWHAGKP